MDAAARPSRRPPHVFGARSDRLLTRVRGESPRVMLAQIRRHQAEQWKRTGILAIGVLLITYVPWLMLGWLHWLGRR
jgi:hypothetical protein